jgi:hypothetical protein
MELALDKLPWAGNRVDMDLCNGRRVSMWRLRSGLYDICVWKGGPTRAYRGLEPIMAQSMIYAIYKGDLTNVS